MKKFLKVCAIAGLCIALLGGLLLVIGAAITGGGVWKQIKDHTAGEMRTEQLSEETVKRLDISLEAGELIIQQGDRLQVTYDTENSGISCRVEGDTLMIEEADSPGWARIGFFGVWFTDRGLVLGSREILLEVPADMTFTSMEIEIQAGGLQADRLAVEESFQADIDAGTMEIEDLTVGAGCTIEVDAGNAEVKKAGIVGKTYFDVNAGNIEVGELSFENAKINCNVGNVRLGLVNAETGYGYTGDCDAGSVTIGGTPFGKFENGPGRKLYTVEVNCNLGNIEIDEP